MSAYVKGCRTSLVAMRLRRARSAGVGQASGEETAGDYPRRRGLFGLWEFDDNGHAFAGSGCRWITRVLIPTTPAGWFGGDFALLLSGPGGGFGGSRWP